MKRPARITRPMSRLLANLADSPSEWQHGYDLSKQAGIQSGTLYPLLIRLEELGLLETRWAEPSQPGRPPRHLYRLTSDGIAYAAELDGREPNWVRAT